MKMQSLKDLYVEQLQDLYDAENQLVKALPKMAKAASEQSGWTVRRVSAHRTSRQRWTAPPPRTSQPSGTPRISAQREP